MQPLNNIEYAFRVYEDMKASQMSIQESDFTALIRCCSMNQRPDRALELYRDMQEAAVVPKLRTYFPLLSVLLASYQQNKGLSTILVKIHNVEHELPTIFFVIFEEMTTKYSLTPTEREYLIGIEFASKTDSSRFYSLLHSMMEDILVPETKECWRTIQRCFDNLPVQSKPLNLNVAFSLVDSFGLVAINGEVLQSIDLEEDTKESLLNQLESFALLADPNRKVKPNNKIKEKKTKQSLNSAAHAKQTLLSEGSNTSATSLPSRTSAKDQKDKLWRDFKLWLQTGGKASSSSTADADVPALPPSHGSDSPADHWFNVVIDGGNVGYYKQNYPGAPSHVDYKQIDQMLQFLLSSHFGSERRKIRPLLVLHCRHVDERSLPNSGEGREMAQLVKAWREGGLLYTTPRGLNDDWFWMFAAVKYNCMVITNDEMRDHHFQLLSPRYSPVLPLSLFSLSLFSLSLFSLSLFSPSAQMVHAVEGAPHRPLPLRQRAIPSGRRSSAASHRRISSVARE
jgi:pentatricopeptide repeat protein